MGMDLSYSYKIVNEDDYNKLKNKILVFSNKYDLDLVESIQVEEVKKSAMFDAIQWKIESEGISWIQNFEYNADTYEQDIFDLVKDYLDEGDLPMTLEEWLNEDNVDGYEIREVHKEEVNGEKIYLLIWCGFW